MEKIVITLKIDSKMFEGADEFLGLVFNEVNETKGIILKKQQECEYCLSFSSVHQFTRFYTDIIRSIPGEEAGKKPFVIKFRFEEIPFNVREEMLIKIMQKRYRAMHIPMVAMTGSRVWELRFPSPEAYFASFIELIDLSTTHVESNTTSIPELVSLHTLV